MSRPDRLVVVTGTGTEVGKTWWAAALARALAARGLSVAARKPVQSFAPDEAGTDADVLADATGEELSAVCPPHRWIPAPMAPPIAAAHLGLPRFTIADLVSELAWPRGVDVGLVEGAGGLRSPLADDGDTRALIDALAPDEVVVVAPAALGVINAARLVLDSLGASPGPFRRASRGVAPGGRRVLVALNRFDDHDTLHRANRVWLAERDGLEVVTHPDELAARWA